MTVSRWYCHDCSKEWLPESQTIGGSGLLLWSPECGCVGCGSVRIEKVTFNPIFPGADYQTTETEYAHKLVMAMAQADQPPSPTPNMVTGLPHVLMAEEPAPVDYWQWI